MSVITYIYPLEPEKIGLDPLKSFFQEAGFECVEVEEKPRGCPDWAFVLLSHKSSKALRFKLVVANNSKMNANSISRAFPRDRKLEVVQQAKKYIWCQLVAGNSSDKELMNGIHLLNTIIARIARLAKAVVHQPENETLYSASGFARYATASGKPMAKSK